MKLAWDAKSRPEGNGYRRERSDQLYHSARWTRLARSFLMAHPLCEECRRQGRLTAAQCVDHIVPMPICRDYFYDVSNLQALCNDCNLAKGNRDKKTIQEWKSLNQGQTNRSR